MIERREYTDEYRRETADYVISSGRPISQMADELGINKKTLARWVKNRRDMLSGVKPTPEEDAEKRAMRKRIREFEMENEFLKKRAPSSPRTKGSRQVPADVGKEGRISHSFDGTRAGCE